LIQALEAIKLIIGLGEPLLGRLLHVDALSLRFREFKIRRDPSCPVCGANPSIHDPIDYEQFCRGTASLRVPAVSPTELQEMLARGEQITIVDVREPFEFEIARLPNSQLIPLGTLAETYERLSAREKTVVLCKTGSRSARATEFLRARGFENSFNLAGGIEAWREEVDPSLRKY
jgi:rhodanese-related sulfurtransferase